MKNVSFSKALLLAASALFLAVACQPNSQSQGTAQAQQSQSSSQMPQGSCPKEKPPECKKPCDKPCGSCDKPKEKECPKPCGPCKEPCQSPCKSCDAPKLEQAVPVESKKSEQACSELCPTEKESVLAVVIDE